MGDFGMYEREKQELIDCARKMEKYQLVTMSGGNVSLKLPCGNILVTPSAMGYDTMVPDDIVIVDSTGNTVEGKRRPSSDTKAILYIFSHRADINALIHTHQPYATAVGMVCDRLPANQVTVIDEIGGEVPVAPFTRSSDEGMGIITVQYATRAKALILKHHGVMAFGKSLEQALCAAVYLEEASKAHLAMLATGRPVPLLTAQQIADEGEERGNYGQ